MERNNTNGAGLLLLLIKSPIILIAALAVFIVGIALFMLLALAVFSDSGDSQNEGGYVPIACQEGKLDMPSFKAQFTNAGKFSGQSDVFIKAAKKANIDPVLLSAIAFHETGRGTSNMVKERNNPGGLYDSSKGDFFKYKSIQDGITAMALTLSDNYIEKGLFTIDAIGSKYAPIDAENDPTGLNAHWVPNVSNMVAEFGGLTMNCELVGFASGFSSPIQGELKITSKFGNRIHPVTGQIAGHRGIDFGCSIGQPIMAAASGTIVDAKVHKTWGNYVLIGHGDKFTLYAHLNELYVSKGQTVGQGIPIGACGSTGRSTGPHLHLEIHLNKAYGKLIDPLPYFSGGGN